MTKAAATLLAPANFLGYLAVALLVATPVVPGWRAVPQSSPSVLWPV